MALRPHVDTMHHMSLETAMAHARAISARGSRVSRGNGHGQRRNPYHFVARKTHSATIAAREEPPFKHTILYSTHSTVPRAGTVIAAIDRAQWPN